MPEIIDLSHPIAAVEAGMAKPMPPRRSQPVSSPPAVASSCRSIGQPSGCTTVTFSPCFARQSAASSPSNPPPITGTASFAYRALNQTIREVFPDVLVAPSLLTAATDSRNYINVTDKVFRFVPVRAKPADLSRFHGTNERLSVDNYADIIRFYRRLLQNVAS